MDVSVVRVPDVDGFHSRSMTIATKTKIMEERISIVSPTSLSFFVPALAS